MACVPEQAKRDMDWLQSVGTGWHKHFYSLMEDEARVHLEVQNVNASTEHSNQTSLDSFTCNAEEEWASPIDLKRPTSNATPKQARIKCIDFICK